LKAEYSRVIRAKILGLKGSIALKKGYSREECMANKPCGLK